MTLQNWIADLVQWLREAFGGAKSKAFTVLEHHSSGDCEAWLLCNEDCTCGVPGMAAMWLIRHHSQAEHDLLLLCFNVAQAREHFTPTGENKLPLELKRQFEVVISGNLKAQKGILATHLFIVGWIERRGKVIRFLDDSEEYYKRVECLCCYAVDLQGVSRAWMGSNEVATKVTRAIAVKVTQIKRQAWEKTIRDLGDPLEPITWLTWLELGAKKLLGEDHQIQPLKAKSFFQKPRESNPNR